MCTFCVQCLHCCVFCLLRLPKKKLSADFERLSSVNSRGRARLPQRRCLADFMVRSPEYSPLRPYQSSSEDSSSEHSSSSYISSPGRDGPTEIPKLFPPPYGFHFGAQKKGLFSSPHNNANKSQSYVPADEGPLSQQGLDMGKRFLSPPAASHGSKQRQWQEVASSPRGILKPPPPYNRLVRTPSLKEYPNHAIRLMPREIVSEELKSWHQRNQLQKLLPSCGEQQSPMNVMSPTSPHMPPFKQVGTEHRVMFYETSTNVHHSLLFYPTNSQFYSKVQQQLVNKFSASYLVGQTLTRCLFVCF